MVSGGVLARLRGRLSKLEKRILSLRIPQVSQDALEVLLLKDLRVAALAQAEEAADLIGLPIEAHGAREAPVER